MIYSYAKKLKQKARQIFLKTRYVSCPAFGTQKVYFTSKGLHHLFYKGRHKKSTRPEKEIQTRVFLLPRAIKVLGLMPLAQEESNFVIKGKHIRYWAFEAVMDNRRIKVIVRQTGKGKKHFWSVIPTWRKARGQVVNAKSNLGRQ